MVKKRIPQGALDASKVKRMFECIDRHKQQLKYEKYQAEQESNSLLDSIINSSRANTSVSTPTTANTALNSRDRNEKNYKTSVSSTLTSVGRPRQSHPCGNKTSNPFCLL